MRNKLTLALILSVAATSFALAESRPVGVRKGPDRGMTARTVASWLLRGPVLRRAGWLLLPFEIEAPLGLSDGPDPVGSDGGKGGLLPTPPAPPVDPVGSAGPTESGIGPNVRWIFRAPTLHEE